MSFFRKFPLTSYDFPGDGSLTKIVDLFRNVEADFNKLDNSIAYSYYNIPDGARPDTASQLIYQTPDYYWTFFVVNDALNAGISAWPMSTQNFENYITQEYDKYGVLVMSGLIHIQVYNYWDENGLYHDLVSPWILTPQEMENRVNLQVGWSYDYSTIVVNHVTSKTSPYISTLCGIDFTEKTIPNSNIVLQDTTTSAFVTIMKYDSSMQQLWLNKGTIGSIVLPSPVTIAGTAVPRMTVINASGDTTGGGCQVEPILSGSDIIGFRILSCGNDYTLPPTQVAFVDTKTYVNGPLTVVSTLIDEDFISNIGAFTLTTINPYLTNDPLYTEMETNNTTWKTGLTTWLNNTVPGAIATQFLALENIILGRNAPNEYQTYSGQYVSAHDFLTGNFDSAIVTVLNYDYEQTFNDSKKRIRIVQPQYIKAFSQKFFTTLNA